MLIIKICELSVMENGLRPKREISITQLTVINLQYYPLDLYLYGDKSYQISYKNVTLQ